MNPSSKSCIKTLRMTKSQKTYRDNARSLTMNRVVLEKNDTSPIFFFLITVPNCSLKSFVREEPR